jgi:hypothetical protein
LTFPIAPEYSTNHHLTQMRILALTDSVNLPALPDEASHGGVFMPNVSKLYFGYLPEGVVSRGILRESKESQLAYQFPTNSRTEYV